MSSISPDGKSPPAAYCTPVSSPASPEDEMSEFIIFSSNLGRRVEEIKRGSPHISGAKITAVADQLFSLGKFDEGMDISMRMMRINDSPDNAKQPVHHSCRRTTCDRERERDNQPMEVDDRDRDDDRDAYRMELE